LVNSLDRDLFAARDAIERAPKSVVVSRPMFWQFWP
jgi:hypothetical protein